MSFCFFIHANEKKWIKTRFRLRQHRRKEEIVDKNAPLSQFFLPMAGWISLKSTIGSCCRLRKKAVGLHGLFIRPSLIVYFGLKCLLKIQSILFPPKKIPKNTKKVKSFRYSNKKIRFRNKREQPITRAVILWTSRTPQKDGLNTQRRDIFLRSSGKYKRSHFLFIKNDKSKKEAFCSNKLNLKLHTACDFLSPKSGHDFKFEALFILCTR